MTHWTPLKSKNEFISSLYLFIIPFYLCRYDNRKKEWKFVAPMLNARCLFSLAVAHGFLYAIGGQFEKRSLELVERYDADANSWEAVSSLKTPRSAAAVAVHRNFIYVVGGATEINSMETATVERFDGNSWVTVN